MESSTLIKLVRHFYDEIHEEAYDLRQGVKWPPAGRQPLTPAAGGYYVLHRYLRPCLTAVPATKDHVIRVLHDGWLAFRHHRGPNHEPVREYGRMTIGMSLVLLYTTPGEVQAGSGLEFATIRNGEQTIPPNCHFAADAIVRASRWFQTRSHLWTEPRPYVDTFVGTVWGNIADLIRTEGISAQWTPGDRHLIRTRSKPHCDRCGKEVDLGRTTCGDCEGHELQYLDQVLEEFQPGHEGVPGSEDP